MTTYSFEDKEYTYTKSSDWIYLQGNTVYTVPTGKIAKLEFDSFHISQSADNQYGQTSVLFYTEGTNIKRKHNFLYYNGADGDVSSLHWYNPTNYARIDVSGGPTSIQYNSTMVSQPQDWSRNGTVDTTPDENTAQVGFQGSNYGARVLGPSYFYMKAGEVLKVISVSRFGSAPSGNLYGNSRFMVFLEDS